MNIDNFKKIVVKIGSSTLIDEKGKPKKIWLKKFAKDIDIVFISNVFKTKSHPRRKGLGTKKLFELCILLKNKLNFALGGITKKNISRLKNKYLKGFAAISYFRE